MGGAAIPLETSALIGGPCKGGLLHPRTGSESRLNRSFGKRLGDDAYAFEELVAELGTAFAVGQLGMIDATIEAHADYVQSWIKVLKDDKKAIFTAASQAAKASSFILNQESSAAIH